MSRFWRRISHLPTPRKSQRPCRGGNASSDPLQSPGKIVEGAVTRWCRWRRHLAEQIGRDDHGKITRRHWSRLMVVLCSACAIWSSTLRVPNHEPGRAGKCPSLTVVAGCQFRSPRVGSTPVDCMRGVGIVAKRPLFATPRLRLLVPVGTQAVPGPPAKSGPVLLPPLPITACEPLPARRGEARFGSAAVQSCNTGHPLVWERQRSPNRCRCPRRTCRTFSAALRIVSTGGEKPEVSKSALSRMRSPIRGRLGSVLLA